jgi:hypothetical protein
MLVSIVSSYILTVAFGFKAFGLLFGYTVPYWGCFLLSAVIHIGVISVSLESGDE